MFETVLDESPTHYRATTYQPELDLMFVEANLRHSTVELATDAKAISISVRDECDATILMKLRKLGVKFIANRFMGAADEDIAKSIGIEIWRMTTHCVEALSDYTIALMLGLGHKMYSATSKMRMNHCSMKGMEYTELGEKTVGVIGTGEVGVNVVKKLTAFGSNVVCFDVKENEKVKSFGAKYVSMKELLETSDVITLHCPFNRATYHLINSSTLKKCKKGVHIINVTSGALVHNDAIIDGLSKGIVGAFGADIIEGDIRSLLIPNSSYLRDPKLEILMTRQNTLITIHEAHNRSTTIESCFRQVLEALKQFQLSQILKQDSELANPYDR